MRTPLRWSVVALLAGLSLVAAACGDDDDNASSESPGASSASSASTAASSPSSDTASAPAAASVGSAATDASGSAGSSTTGAVATGGPTSYEITAGKTLTFVDTTRKTSAVEGVTPAADTRTLPTLVVGPNGSGPFPLIVFSHGLTAHAADYRHTIDSIARAGFVVAAPDFPETTGGSGFAAAAYVANQPADLSFVIDQMLKANDDSASEWKGKINSTQIGAVGHSLGAITTYGFAYSGCCSDARIKAAVPISGAVINFGDGTFDFKKVPAFIIHGDADEVVPYQSSVDAYAKVQASKYFLTVKGGSHSGFFAGSNVANAPVERSIADFLRAYVAGDADAKGRLQGDVVSGVTALEVAA